MKKALALVLALVMMVALVACGNSSSSNGTDATNNTTDTTTDTTTNTTDTTTANTDTTNNTSTDGSYDASGDPKIDLIFTANASSADWHGMAMQTFADAVAKYSGGSVTCSVYPDSTLYSSENEWDAINQGQANGGADLAYISFQTLSTQPNLAWCEMIGTAYFWTDYDHMTNTLNGEIGQQIFDKIAAATNVTPINAFYLGARVINTTQREINSYADMKGLLLRMPSSEAWLNLGRALGAEPTSLAFSELYTALQTGAIEGQDNPLPSDWNAGFYEVAKHFAITNHVVDSILPCINTNTWNSLTDAQKQAVRDAFEDARVFNDTNRIEQENSLVNDLIDAGCSVTYPDINEFKENATAWYNAHPEIQANWDMDLYNQIQALG